MIHASDHDVAAGAQHLTELWCVTDLVWRVDFYKTRSLVKHSHVRGMAAPLRSTRIALFAGDDAPPKPRPRGSALKPTNLTSASACTTYHDVDNVPRNGSV